MKLHCLLGYTRVWVWVWVKMGGCGWKWVDEGENQLDDWVWLKMGGMGETWWSGWNRAGGGRIG